MRPSDTPSAEPEPTRAESEALAWFGRKQYGFTPEESAAFDGWLEDDPENRRVFEELSGTWELLGQVPSWMIERRKPPAKSAARRGRWVVAVPVALVMAAAASFAIAYVGLWRPTHFSQAYAAGIGDVLTFALPDGSTLRLNTDTALSVRFSKGERRIKLERGEALFTVAKNAARPFFVEAGDVVVRAVGTAFDVRMDGQAVDVLVTEGKVRVDQRSGGKSLLPQVVSSGEPLLVAGNRAVVAAQANSVGRTTIAPVADDEALRNLAWEKHQIEFVSAPLAQIVAEFNRYNRHSLVLGDPSLANREFGGSFRSDDSAGFVRMLTQNFSIRAREDGNRTVLTLSR